VLGGGDTAMDCVRTAVRQGAESVHCVYRRDLENMPGSQREVSHAQKEGVQFAFNTVPVSLQHDNQRLTGLHVVRTRLIADAAGGRARPEVIEGSEELLPCDSVIFAFGYRPSPAAWLQDLTVATTKQGLVETTQALSGQTSNPAIFAGGDMVLGSDLVVTAIADARKAAKSIINFLEIKQPKLKSA
jgi:glutamate synthase (NADPH/NADH) small chain